MKTDKINTLSMAGLGKLVYFLKPETDSEMIKQIVDEYSKKQNKELSEVLKAIYREARNITSRGKNYTPSWEEYDRLTTELNKAEKFIY